MSSASSSRVKPDPVRTSYTKGQKSMQKLSPAVRVMEFLREHVLVKDRNLEPFRAKDVEKKMKMMLKPMNKSFPEPWNRKRQAEFVKMCVNMLCELFCPQRPLPYFIDHFYFEDEYVGMGLFTDRTISLVDLAKVIKRREWHNCEMVHSTATGDLHDSVYTCHWSETGAEARVGWWWKHKLVPGATRDALTDPGATVALTTEFAISGRLMFANHDSRCHYMFKSLKPTTPGSNQAKITGTMSFETQKEDIGGYLHGVRG